MSAVAVFDAAYRRVSAGHGSAFTIRHAAGAVQQFDPETWCRDELDGDRDLVGRCTGPTLDVGCGPGRLVAALLGRGLPALGIDVSAAAVALARQRGATALRRDVFAPLPGTGRWHDLLLADGNIGIGGDPERLLRRCRQLLAPGGRLHVEAAAPGSASWCGIATTSHGVTLPWASVPTGDLPALAAATALHVTDVRTEAGRWFATLTTR